MAVMAALSLLCHREGWDNLKASYADLLKARQEKHKAFEEFLRIKAKEFDEMRPKRIELRGGVESDDEDAYTLVEEEEREEIARVEEIIDDGEEIEIGDD